MAETKFLSKSGLETLVTNLKSYIQTHSSDNAVIVKGDVDNSAILKGEYSALGTNYYNKAISQVSTAIGAAVTAGLKGWYYTKVNLAENLIWLSDKRSTGLLSIKISTTTATTPDNTSFSSGWKVGDEVTIVNNKKYERCAKIADINGNMIKLDKLPFNSSTLVTSATSIGDLNEPDEFSITAIRITDNDTLKTRTVSSYDKGGIDFGGGANAVGIQTYALNIGAHAEGIQTVAYGQYSHAEGFKTEAAYAAHAEGKENKAIGSYSHVEGELNEALSFNSHAEGYGTKAGNFDEFPVKGSEKDEIGRYTHSEGRKTAAKGSGAHAEGYLTAAIGKNSHAEGEGTITKGIASHSSGYNTLTLANFSHAEGHSFRKFDPLYIENLGNIADIKSEIETDWDDKLANNDQSPETGRFGATLGDCSHIEGITCITLASYSHAEGEATKAKGRASHSEGEQTVAYNRAEHAEGKFNKSNANTIHSVGIGTSNNDRKNAYEITSDGKNYILGVGSYNGTNPSNNNDVKSVIDKIQTKQKSLETALEDSTYQLSSQLEVLSNSVGSFETMLEASKLNGGTNIEILDNSINVTDIPEFTDITLKDFGIYKTGSIKDNFVFIAGSGTNSGIQINGGNSASGYYSLAEGYATKAIGTCAHAEGEGGVLSSAYPWTGTDKSEYVGAVGDKSHTEGTRTNATANSAHAEGFETQALDNRAHAEGTYTIAKGNSSHAEGYATKAKGRASHAEGEGGVLSEAYPWTGTDKSEYLGAVGDKSHTEGTRTNATANSAHAEGFETQALNNRAHAEGTYSIAKGNTSHAEGYATIAIGDYSHAGGYKSISSGKNSFSHGNQTIANNDNEYAFGKYNVSNTNTIYSVGIGTTDTTRKNAHEIISNGKHYIYGLGGYDGTNPYSSNDLASIINLLYENVIPKVVTGTLVTSSNLISYNINTAENTYKYKNVNLYLSNPNGYYTNNSLQINIDGFGFIDSEQTELNIYLSIDLGNYEGSSSYYYGNDFSVTVNLPNYPYPLYINGFAETDEYGYVKFKIFKDEMGWGVLQKIVMMIEMSKFTESVNVMINKYYSN